MGNDEIKLVTEKDSFTTQMEDTQIDISKLEVVVPDENDRLPLNQVPIIVDGYIIPPVGKDCTGHSVGASIAGRIVDGKIVFL